MFSSDEDMLVGLMYLRHKKRLRKKNMGSSVILTSY